MQGSQVARTVGGLFAGGGWKSSSRIVTSTDDGSPAVTSGGSAPSDTVKVSSSSSASSVVEIVPVPVVSPPSIVMLASAPKSSVSVSPDASASGIVTLCDNASDSIAVTVTGCPSSTGLGDTDRLTLGRSGSPSSSRIVTSTDDGSPAVTSVGSPASDTVNVSSSLSASSVVEIVPVPVNCPPLIVMLASAPKSPVSALPDVSSSGIVTVFDNVSDSRAVTVTDCPSSTGFGETDRLTVGVGGGGGGESSSRIVTSTDDGSPAVTSVGSPPSDTVNVSSSLSASSVVAIVPVPVVCPPATVTLASAPKSSDSAVPDASTSGIVTLFDNVSDSRAVTVTDCPSSTGFGETARLTVGFGGGVVILVKVSLAMRTLENLPVPAMRVMTPCGFVAGLDSVNSVPSSVPASYGKRSTTCDCRHSFAPSSRDTPDTPTNQSGLGPIMDRSVTSGCVLVTSILNVAVPVPVLETPC